MIAPASLLAALALTAAAVARPFTLADLDWIEGTWRSESVDAKGVRSIAEEHWGAAIGETRLGWFRALRDGRARFYEFEALRRDSAGVSLVIKHFSGDFTGWEAADSAAVYRLVRTGEREAHFENRRDAEFPRMSWRAWGDSLRVTLEGDGPNAPRLSFGFVRVTPAAPGAGAPARPEHPE